MVCVARKEELCLMSAATHTQTFPEYGLCFQYDLETQTGHRRYTDLVITYSLIFLYLTMSLPNLNTQ